MQGRCQDGGVSADQASEQQPLGSLLSDRVATAWPVVIVPAAVVVLAALAGLVAGQLATLVVGITVMTLLASLVVHRITRGRHRWVTACVVTVVALSLLGLGSLRLRGAHPEPRPATVPVASGPVPPAQLPARSNAGHQFTQQQVNGTHDFRGADLRGAQFIRLDLRGVDFSGANAAGASFFGSRLDRASFRGADLGGAIFTQTCLRNATMRGADLTGAVATDADVSSVDLTAADIALTAAWPRPDAASPTCG